MNLIHYRTRNGNFDKYYSIHVSKCRISNCQRIELSYLELSRIELSTSRIVGIEMSHLELSVSHIEINVKLLINLISIDTN